MKHIALQQEGLRMIRSADARLVSYNIEMAEVTGGTFWKSYSPGQLAGTEPFSPVKDPGDTESLMQLYPPIDFSDGKLRFLAGKLGPAWVRVSGTWATSVYYDWEDRTGGRPPKGYQSVLTRGQWDGVLDFVEAVGAKLLISAANCEGNHSAGEPWNPGQLKRLLDYSKAYGVPRLGGGIHERAQYAGDERCAEGLYGGGLPAGSGRVLPFHAGELPRRSAGWSLSYLH